MRDGLIERERENMIAKYKGTCAVCGLPINVGDDITWSRQERGKAYHVACRPEGGLRESPVTRPEDGLREPTRTPRPVTATVEPVTVTVPHGTTAKGLEETLVGMDTDTLASLLNRVLDLKDKPVASPPVRAKKMVKLNPTSEWYEVFGAVLPHTNRVLLIGPPSSGKSTTAMLTAGTKHRVTMTETTSREDLIGMFHLIDGATKWVDGPFTSAMRNGESILLDEIDRYSPECASLLYSLIDDAPHVSLPSGELVQAKDGYKVIMTSNEGIDTLPVAVQDRIEVIIIAANPHEDALSMLPEAAQNVVCRWYKAQPVQPLKLFPTVRRMKAFYRLSSAGLPNDVAGSVVFGKDGYREVLSAITSAESVK